RSQTGTRFALFAPQALRTAHKYKPLSQRLSPFPKSKVPPTPAQAGVHHPMVPCEQRIMPIF
ncbi:MAG: hypothetical protein AAGB16_05375, partial [Pseudomonadota bacterium]